MWNARAAAAERAVITRYVGHVPGIAWGRARSRRGKPERARPGRSGAEPASPTHDEPAWHYWWSAHLVDAAVDAAEHRPSDAAWRRARALARGVWVRNGGTWARPFYDDLAWLGLAFERGGARLGRSVTADRIAARLERVIDPRIGALPWSVGSSLFNAPANGPAAILLARTGRTRTARALVDWMADTLRDPESGLVFDGVIDEPSGRATVTALYTYCQGVALGAEVELVRAGDEAARARAASLLDAVANWTGPDLILPGQGGGDGGLFAGITARYLAGAVQVLGGAPAETARDLVLRNADAAWRGRAEFDGLPYFSADWHGGPDLAPDAPERDLSVQLSAWLLLEAAVEVSELPAPDGRTR